MTPLEELRKQLPALRKCAEAIPEWKKVVLEHARQAEIKLGFIKE